MLLMWNSFESVSFPKELRNGLHAWPILVVSTHWNHKGITIANWIVEVCASFPSYVLAANFGHSPYCLLKWQLLGRLRAIATAPVLPTGYNTIKLFCIEEAWTESSVITRVEEDLSVQSIFESSKLYDETRRREDDLQNNRGHQPFSSIKELAKSTPTNPRKA